MIPSQTIRAAPLVLLLALSSCAQLATVKLREPNYLPVHGAAEVAMAKKCVSKEPLNAMGCYLKAARDADHALKANPNDDTTRRDYNFAVARVVEILIKTDADITKTVLTVPSSKGSFQVTSKLPAGTKNHLKDFDDHAADTVVVGGKYFKDRHVSEGIGAPFVGIGREPDKNSRKVYGSEYKFGTLTAVIHFSGTDDRRAQVEFVQPLNTSKVTLDGHTYPVEADISAPFAMVMAKERPEKLGLVRLLNPEKYAQTARLTRFEPYDPNRIPVLFVHGLQDTPASWAPMVNSLLADDEIRQHYQIWVYSYPSGYPYPYSGSLLRKELDGVDRTFPDHKKIVLVGHSMGGLISRLMITDSGDQIWVAYFGKDPEHTKLAGLSRHLIEPSLVFEHRQDVSRVIFMSAPHHGSDFASNWIGRIGSSLIHAPSTILKLGRSVLAVVTIDRSAMKMNHMPNSIDTLAPKNRFVVAINKIPITPGIPYHSIIGDRGRGDTPNSSDGIVAYWSSHMDGAQSELIVPSDHGSPRNPEAMEEVKRILKLHLKSSSIESQKNDTDSVRRRTARIPVKT
jgi:pimeloyl-ACP methyl ester carboxylesterase